MTSPVLEEAPAQLDDGTPLYHYTCEHSFAQLGNGVAELRPMPHPYTGLRLVWLTDLDVPMREALGLTMHILACDRIAHRYRVTDMTHCQPWTTFARSITPGQRAVYEDADGVMPMHWWVAPAPVPVIYDPTGSS